MRTPFHRTFAIVTMLALLFGSQLCTLVNCLPAHAHALHPCCAAAAARHARSSHQVPGSCTRPCCIEIALPHAPQLDRPLAAEAPHALAVLALATALAAAPAPAALAPSPPGDERIPHAPPRTAAGTRAPPLA